jgi:stromal membrane-associated protein
MQSIQKWGNKRVNLYWEAHLKPGHQPPDQFVFSVSAGMQTNMTSFYSKLDSFIRSKYESRRWAVEGPPPADPSTLESSTPAESSTSAVFDSVAPISPPHPPSTSSPSPAPVVTTTTPVVASRAQHQLLSAQHKRIPSIPKPISAGPAAVAAGATPASSTQNDLFTLDFSPATSPAATPAPKKDVKNDILSLFGQAPTVAAQSTTSTTTPSPWSTDKPNPSLFGAPQGHPAPNPSMMGTSGVSMWGAGTGWSQSTTAPVPAPNAFGSFGVPSVPSAMSGANIWNGPVSAAPAPAAVSESLYYSEVPILKRTPQNPLFATQDVWGNPAPGQPANGGNIGFSNPSNSTTSAPAAKKDDAFGDIWSSFK